MISTTCPRDYDHFNHLLLIYLDTLVLVLYYICCHPKPGISMNTIFDMILLRIIITHTPHHNHIVKVCVSPCLHEFSTGSSQRLPEFPCSIHWIFCPCSVVGLLIRYTNLGFLHSLCGLQQLFRCHQWYYIIMLSILQPMRDCI